MIQPLYQASANQFIATADAWILHEAEPGRPKQLWGLSIIGPQTSVKAIAAAILKAAPETVAITPITPQQKRAKTQIALRTPESGKWRAKTARLKMSRAWHCIVYPAMAEYEPPPENDDTNFLIIARHGVQAAAGKYAKFLNRRTDIPIHPSWAEWLWERAKTNGEAQRLETPQHTAAWLCRTDEVALKSELSRAVASGELTA